MTAAPSRRLHLAPFLLIHQGATELFSIRSISERETSIPRPLGHPALRKRFGCWAMMTSSLLAMLAWPSMSISTGLEGLSPLPRLYAHREHFRGCAIPAGRLTKQLRPYSETHRPLFAKMLTFSSRAVPLPVRPRLSLCNSPVFLPPPPVRASTTWPDLHASPPFPTLDPLERRGTELPHVSGRGDHYLVPVDARCRSPGPGHLHIHFSLGRIPVARDGLIGQNSITFGNLFGLDFPDFGAPNN
jgi:hypothetical protein